MIRRDTRRGTGWIGCARRAYWCHRCQARIQVGSRYYRCLHRPRGHVQNLRVCYCSGCAAMRGHGAWV